MKRATCDDLPIHLKFGYQRMVEMEEIERDLRSLGLRGADLHFASIRQYENNHANDPSFREKQELARERGEKWVATPSAQRPSDLIRQALEQIRDGHNDPRTLARDVLAALGD